MDNEYGKDGLCHNSEAGAFGHECGKPATWIGIMRNGWKSGFCDECKEHGHERKQFDAFVRISN